jgi:hypothetical protein
MRREGTLGEHTERWQQRMAAQIASQLPEDPREALAVLSMARKVVIYLDGGGTTIAADALAEARTSRRPFCRTLPQD